MIKKVDLVFGNKLKQISSKSKTILSSKSCGHL